MYEERVRREELREILLPPAIYENLIAFWDGNITLREALERILHGDGINYGPAPLPLHVKEAIELYLARKKIRQPAKITGADS